MHRLLKFGIPSVLFTIIAIVVIVPVTLHFRSRNNGVSLTSKTIAQRTIAMFVTTTSGGLTNITANTMTNMTDTTTITTLAATTTRSTTTAGVATTWLTTSGAAATGSTTMGTTSNTNTSSTIRSQYSSALTNNSQMFCRISSCTNTTIYYFEAIQINLSISGYYTIVSNSSMDTYGYIFHTNFNPAYLSQNVLGANDDDGGNSQFKLTTMLYSSIKYILVTATYYPNVTGAFFIFGTGPASLSFSRIYAANTSLSTPVQSQYLSALTYNSPQYCRLNSCANVSYSYQAIPLNVSTPFYYSIKSNSSIDTYGYIYNNSFNPASINDNFLLSNDDGANSGQFLLTLVLQPMVKYILVVTTYAPNVTGSFTIIATGSAPVNFIGG